MSLYKDFSEILIYKSDPNRNRIYTIPRKAFIHKGDITDKELMEKYKIKLEYLGHSDIEIYLTKAINDDIPNEIWSYYKFYVKKYDNSVDVKKKFKLINQLHGREKTIKWFLDLYEKDSIELLGNLDLICKNKGYLKRS